MFKKRLYPQSIPNQPKSHAQKPRRHLPLPLHKLMQAFTSTCKGKRPCGAPEAGAGHRFIAVVDAPGAERLAAQCDRTPETEHYEGIGSTRDRFRWPGTSLALTLRALPQLVVLKPRWQ